MTPKPVRTAKPALTAQHTPGPWYLNPRGWIVQSTGDIVTRLECSNNGEADARLIAAAPELLAAARLAVAWAEQVPAPYRDWPHIVAARAAIAKAEQLAAREAFEESELRNFIDPESPLTR